MTKLLSDLGNWNTQLSPGPADTLSMSSSNSIYSITDTAVGIGGGALAFGVALFDALTKTASLPYDGFLSESRLFKKGRWIAGAVLAHNGLRAGQRLLGLGDRSESPLSDVLLLAGVGIGGLAMIGVANSFRGASLLGWLGAGIDIANIIPAYKEYENGGIQGWQLFLQAILTLTFGVQNQLRITYKGPPLVVSYSALVDRDMVVSSARQLRSIPDGVVQRYVLAERDDGYAFRLLGNWSHPAHIQPWERLVGAGRIMKKPGTNVVMIDGRSAFFETGLYRMISSRRRKIDDFHPHTEGLNRVAEVLRALFKVEVEISETGLPVKLP